MNVDFNCRSSKRFGLNQQKLRLHVRGFLRPGVRGAFVCLLQACSSMFRERNVAKKGSVGGGDSQMNCNLQRVILAN